VRSRGSLYAPVLGRGVFRVRLSGGAPEPLALHWGAVFDDFRLSPGGRYLVYAFFAGRRSSAFIYDLEQGGERQISGLAVGARLSVSPDDRWAVASPASRGTRVIWMLNMASGETQRRALPAPDDTGKLVDGHWAADGQYLLAARGESGGEVFWRVSPDTGGFSQVPGMTRSGFALDCFHEAGDVQRYAQGGRAVPDQAPAQVAGGR
jgi:Tol biopolymer transport system component